MILKFLLFLLIVGSCNAAEVEVEKIAAPQGLVIVVIDGMGASYVYPEHSPYALDGTLLEKVILYNLTGGGARVLDLRVRVPETSKSHSILVTGSLEAEPGLLGPTIFDAARESGLLCLAVLQRGDFLEMVTEQDLALYFDDNSLHAEPSLAFRDGAPLDLQKLMEEWRDLVPSYVTGVGASAYAGYGCWGIDAAADMVRNMGPRKFLLIVNVGSADSCGHNLGADGYLQAIGSLDEGYGRLQEACREKDVVLLVTADHGMAFPTQTAKGGHASDKYAARLESLRVPLTAFGPGVDDLNLGGIWFQEDLAPTVLDLLDIPGNLSSGGRPLPIKESYDLQILGAPGPVELYRDGELLANASADREILFRGLARGLYSIKCAGQEQDVCINGDAMLDLSGEVKDGMILNPEYKKIVGIILILIINLIGAILIFRIIKKEEA
jgi:2,3-bisphosphoglycerate-independent phosphoglycerate mutase